MGEEQADHDQSPRYHPQVYHLAEYRSTQGSGPGEDLIRLQIEAICPTIIRQGFAQGGKHQRSCTGTSRTAHARTADRKEYASDSCGGKTDTQETQAIRNPEPAVCRYATSPISARIPRPHHFQKQRRRGMRVYITSKTRPEPCLAETLRFAELAARLRQDSRRLSPRQIPAQVP